MDRTADKPTPWSPTLTPWRDGSLAALRPDLHQGRVVVFFETLYTLNGLVRSRGPKIIPLTWWPLAEEDRRGRRLMFTIEVPVLEGGAVVEQLYAYTNSIHTAEAPLEVAVALRGGAQVNWVASTAVAPVAEPAPASTEAPALSSETTATPVSADAASPTAVEERDEAGSAQLSEPEPDLEEQASTWLAAKLRPDDSVSKDAADSVSKGEFRAECLEKFELSVTRYDHHIWPNARKRAGLSLRGKPGPKGNRKKKKSPG
jgi:hypothetical protein